MTGFDDPKKLYIREKLSCRADIRGRVFSFSLRVEDLDAKGILTTIPDLAGSRLLRGQELLIRYFREDSAYQFLTRVQGEEQRGSVYLLRLGFPERITRYQRRKWKRVNMAGTVRYRPMESQQPMERGYIRDLSGGGMKISVPRTGIFNTGNAPTGTILLLEFLLESGHSFAGITGEIKRVNNDTERPTNVEVQVIFTRIHKKTQERLATLVRRYS